MMLDAYEPLTILERFPLQIETITAYDGNLVVGTKQGHLLMYSITSDSTARMKINLLRSNKNFSRKPITQIAVVPEHQILISLSDQLISIHDLTVFNFPLMSTLQKTRGATAFDLDVKHHTSMTGEAAVTIRLVVAVRRKLQFYYWKSRQFYDLREELTLPDTPKSLMWCGEAIAVAFKYDYRIVKLTGEQKELLATGRSQQPLMTKMPHDCIALERDEKTIYMDAEGKSTCSYSLEWPEQPLAMVYDEPYMIAVVSKNVQIQSQDPKLNVQVLDLERPKFLATTVSSKNKKQVFVASATHIWCLIPVAISNQIPQLLAAKHFDLALKLADLWDECNSSKEHMKQYIKKLQALHLFCERNFEEAMTLFFSLNTDLLFVIGLYPDLVPEEYRAKLQYPHPIPPLSGDELEKALKELIDFLLQMRHKLLESKEKTVSSISPASPSVKTKAQKLQIIDTTLLKCYLKTKDSLIVPLLRMPDNRVSVEEGERVLRQAQKYAELVLLLQNRQLHPRALELLLRHSKRKESPLYGHVHTVEYLQKLGPDYIELVFEYGGWVLKSHPEDGLKIFTGGYDPSEVELLPRPRVLNFIKKTQKSLVIPYLEHLIWEWGDTSPIIHNELVHQYRQIVMLSLREGEDEDEFMKRREETRGKLLKFLKISQSYTAATILVYFPHDDLYEERAILLGRLGQHQQALKLYIDTLEDVNRALEYCHSQYSSVGHSSEVYLILLKLLLRSSRNNSPCPTISPENKGQIQYEGVILDILKNYSNRIDVAQALKTLPDDMNVHFLKSFILQSMIRLSTIKKDNQILRGLTQAILDQTKSELNSTQMHKIYLSDKSVCTVCCKKFTKSSAFAWHSNGEISHFLCKEQRNSRR